MYYYAPYICDMLAKIVRKLNRTVGDEKYYKYLVPVSNKLMEELGWSGDTEIKVKKSGKKLIVKEHKS